MELKNHLRYNGAKFIIWVLFGVIWLLGPINCAITNFDTQNLAYCTFDLHFGQRLSKDKSNYLLTLTFGQKPHNALLFNYLYIYMNIAS